MTPELYRALTQTIRAVGIRLRPDAKVEQIANYLQQNGVTLSHTGEMLTATQNGQPADVARLLTALTSKPELKGNFVVPTDDVVHLSDLSDPQSKSDFITKHGFDAFQKLVSESRNPKLTDVNLGPDATAKDVKKWTVGEKVAFISQYGDGAYARCLARRG